MRVIASVFDIGMPMRDREVCSSSCAFPLLPSLAHLFIQTLPFCPERTRQCIPVERILCLHARLSYSGNRERLV